MAYGSYECTELAAYQPIGRTRHKDAMEEDLLHRLRCRSLWSYQASENTVGANKPKPANPKSASAAQKHRDGHHTVLECSPPVQAVLAVRQQGLKECKRKWELFPGFLLKYYLKDLFVY